MREKIKIIRRYSQMYGYKIVARGYIKEFLAKDLESLADDLVESNSLEISQKLRNFKKFQRRKNGLIIQFQEYLSSIPKYEFDIKEYGNDIFLLSIRIEIKVRRSILHMLRETYSC